MSKNATADRLRSLFQIARRNRTGVLTVRGGRSPRSFFIEDGVVRIVTGADPAVYFAQRIEEGDVLKPRRLAKAAKLQESSGDFLLACIEDLGYADSEDLVDFVDQVVRKELTRLVDAPDGTLGFAEGPIDFEAFGDGIEDYLLDRSLEDWVLDAAAVRSAVEIFRSVFPTDRDVFAPWGDSPVSDDSRSRVLEIVDGLKTLDEIVAKAAVDRFDVLRALYELERDDRVRRRSAEELLGVAREFQREGRIDQSLRMYELAKTHGGDEMEIAWNLGRNYELMGDDDSAVAEYLDYSRLAESAERPDDALRGLRKALEMQPENLALRENVLRLLENAGQKEAASREICELLPLLMTQGRNERAAELILREWESNAVDAAACARLSTCLEALGRDERSTFVELAERFGNQANRVDDALRLLEHASRETADESIDLRRAILLDRAGRASEAVSLLSPLVKSLVATSDSGDAERVERTRLGLEILVEQDVANEAVRTWLAELYDARDQRDTAARHLEDLARSYENAGERSALVSTLERLIEIEPDRIEHRQALGLAYLDAGRDRAASALLCDVATELAADDRAEQALELLDRVADSLPWDLDVVRTRLECGFERDAEEERRERLVRAARLAHAIGRMEEAAEWFERADSVTPASVDEIRAWIECLEKTERSDATAALWARIARNERERGNAGSMCEACERAIELGFEDEELLSWIAPEPEPEPQPEQEAAPESEPAPRPEVIANGGTSRAEFGDSVLELMRSRSGAAERVAKPAASPKPAEVAAEPEPTPGNVEGLDPEQFARSNREDKPSISGIVERLKSFKG